MYVCIQRCHVFLLWQLNYQNIMPNCKVNVLKKNFFISPRRKKTFLHSVCFELSNFYEVFKINLPSFKLVEILSNIPDKQN